MVTSPTRITVRQPTVPDGTRWKVTSVLAALDLHESGDFRESGLLAEAMGRDDRISGVRGTRTRALMGRSGVEFAIKPAVEAEVDPATRKPRETDETRRSRALADEVGAWWWDVFDEPTIARILDDGVMVGVHVSRVEWERTATAWNIVRLRRWHPANVRWDENLDRFIARTTEGDEVIEPGDPNWFVYCPGGDRSWMCGAVRALGLAFVMRAFDWRDWARFNERHGNPVIMIKEPAAYDHTLKKAFYSGIRSMGSTGFIRVPKMGPSSNDEGFDVSLLEPKDRSWESFQRFKEGLDVAIAILLLGQNLSTEVQGGSFAATQAHMRVRQDFLDGDAESLATSVRGGRTLRNPGPLSHWVRFNRGEDAAVLTPWPQWDTGIPEDLKTKAEGAKAMGEAADAWKKIPGVKIKNLEEIAEKYGFEVEVDADAKPPTPPKPPGTNDDAGTEDDASDAADADAAEARAHARVTGNGGTRATASGFVEGQEYVDGVARSATAALAKVFAEDVADLLRIVNEFDDYEEMRAAILSKYQDDLPPSEAQAIVAAALKMAELGGRTAVRQDAPATDDDTP